MFWMDMFDIYHFLVTIFWLLARAMSCDVSDQQPTVNIQYRSPKVEKLHWSRQKIDKIFFFF